MLNTCLFLLFIAAKSFKLFVSANFRFTSKQLIYRLDTKVVVEDEPPPDGKVENSSDDES